MVKLDVLEQSPEHVPATCLDHGTNADVPRHVLGPDDLPTLVITANTAAAGRSGVDINSDCRLTAGTRGSGGRSKRKGATLRIGKRVLCWMDLAALTPWSLGHRRRQLRRSRWSFRLAGLGPRIARRYLPVGEGRFDRAPAGPLKPGGGAEVGTVRRRRNFLGASGEDGFDFPRFGRLHKVGRMDSTLEGQNKMCAHDVGTCTTCLATRPGGQRPGP